MPPFDSFAGVHRFACIRKVRRLQWVDSRLSRQAGVGHKRSVVAVFIVQRMFERILMSRPLSLGELLDEWYQWAEWISSKDRDESKGEDLTGWFEFNWVVEEDPELAWEAIVEAVDQPRIKSYLGHLAAGPLEDLLDVHGPAFIERIEQCARSNATFARLLCGVWQSSMPESIWRRVQAVQTR